MTLFSLNNVVIGYQSSAISTALNCQLPEKQILVLLGANGCGKTTLLKSMLKLIPSLKGEIYFKNKALSKWDNRQLAQSIGYVPQAHHAIFPFKVEDVVLFGRTAHLSWYQVPQKQDRDIAQQCLATLGIEHLRHRIYNHLSGGEQQLVLIARALAPQPDCLIMDEPTSNLDFGNQIRILEYIYQLKEQGLSILFTTHQPEQAKQIADQVLLFHQGNLIAQGQPQQVMTLSNLSLIYQLPYSTLQKNLSFLMMPEEKYEHHQ